MALTQTQIIQSLGEALSWFEKELSWGVEPAELRHLSGRIGELYAAMITRGQMAPETNQRGYDVISADNERISVKTVTSSSHVVFKGSTFQFIDRIMVLRLNVSADDGPSIEALLDAPTQVAMEHLIQAGSDWRFSIGSIRRQPMSLENLAVTAMASFQDMVLQEYENGTIQVHRNGENVSPAKPILRDAANQLGIALFRDSGTLKNTRQLGSEVIKKLLARNLSDLP
jgi:hypothetical protein